MFLDRQNPTLWHLLRRLPHSSLFAPDEEDTLSEDVEEAEKEKRLEEHWKFDVDNAPPIGPDGAEDHGQQLIDDYDPTYVNYSLSKLLSERFTGS